MLVRHRHLHFLPESRLDTTIWAPLAREASHEARNTQLVYVRQASLSTRKFGLHANCKLHAGCVGTCKTCRCSCCAVKAFHVGCHSKASGEQHSEETLETAIVLCSEVCSFKYLYCCNSFANRNQKDSGIKISGHLLHLCGLCL